MRPSANSCVPRSNVRSNRTGGSFASAGHSATASDHSLAPNRGGGWGERVLKNPDAPLDIESLDQEGRGVARRDGKAIFVEGALPGERVSVSVFKKKPTFELATAGMVHKAAASRVAPRCKYFGLCGG